MAILDKDKRIKKKIKELAALAVSMDEDRKKSLQSLIENIAFMSITLEDLQEEINKNGVTEQYKNGNNQFGVKESTSVRVYSSLIKNYNTSLKQFLDQLPQEDNAKKKSDDFDDFVDQK